MKLLMLKQKVKKYAGRRPLLSYLLIASVLIMSGVSGSLVLADQFDQQIRDLQQQNVANQKIADELADRASNYQDAVYKLEVQIAGLQKEINANQAKSDDLQKQITTAEEELAKQKKILGENIKTMYLESQISTIEMLATSRNLSDFVDKEQYRAAVRDKIKSTVDKITDLKAQLKSQRDETEKLLKEKRLMQSQFDGERAQQAQLLGYTEQQKVQYDQQIKSNRTRISELIRQQAIENARLFGGGQIIVTSRCDIYPQNWCNAPMDSLVDSWGMYNRECVSWTAFRVALSGRYMPYGGGRGNANQWDDNARAAGIPVDNNPRVGDVAVSNSGYYGHTMYVEAVNDDGTIAVSQFNHDWGGTYSFVPKMPKGNLVFIHF